MEKKKRKDCYFGLHFDFHAVAATKGIGTCTDRAAIGELLDKTKPDFLQIDTKGHPGYTSFFSKHGSVAPGLEVDFLKVIREETAKRGIPLYAHHSGIWDKHAVEEHPEWAAVDREGNPSDRNISIASDYADAKLIPQLIELAQDYGLDGAWIDGECWAAMEDYSPALLEEFYQKTGYAQVEEPMDSPSRKAYMDFLREKLHAYERRFITEVKKACPDFEIACNFSASVMMPVAPYPELDYLSGDVNITVYAQVLARCFVGLGKPWDVMAWGCNGLMEGFGVGSESGLYPLGLNHTQRLMRNAAIALSQGGAFQMCLAATPQGEICTAAGAMLKDIADFMAQRKALCFQSTPLKNAAVLHTLAGRNHRIQKQQIYHFASEDLDGLLCSLFLDGGRPVDVIYSFEVENQSFREHSAVILPEFGEVSDAMAQNLRDYVQEGGSLIVCGRRNCQVFADLTGARVLPQESAILYVEAGDHFFGLQGDMAFFEKNGAEDLCVCRPNKMTYNGPTVSAAIGARCGKGKVVLIGWDVFTDYGKTRNFGERDFMRRVLDYADPEPTVCLKSGTRRVELVPAEKDGKLLVNLINTAELYYDLDHDKMDGDIPPLMDLEIAVRCPEEPKSMWLEPEHIRPASTREGDYLRVKIDRLDIHSVLVIERDKENK